jgi:hypothetical protein
MAETDYTWNCCKMYATCSGFVLSHTPLPVPSSHKVRIDKEYHSVCPLVGIGTLPAPLSPASVPLTPEPGEGDTLACGRGVGGRVSSKQTKISFGSNRNKPKQDLFRVCFGLFRETQKKIFRFISVFRTFIETTETNRTVSKRTETIQNFLKNTKICSLNTTNLQRL